MVHKRTHEESTLKLISNTKSKIFGNPVFELENIINLVLLLNVARNLQELRMSFIDFFNLFSTDIPLLYLLTTSKIFGFLMFSGGIVVEHC